MIPSSVQRLRTITAIVATLFASRQADPSPSVAIVLEKVVTNAVDKAPSAKRSRSRFGRRNAALNASIFTSAPKSARKIWSRANPRIRLHITASPTTPAARALTLRDDAAGTGVVAGVVEGMN